MIGEYILALFNALKSCSEQALETRNKLLGAEHPDVASSLNDLALLYYSQRRYTVAEPFLKQALETRQKLLGTEHPSVASSLNNLALLYKSQGKYKEAKSLYQQALEMRKKLLGAELRSSLVMAGVKEEKIEGDNGLLTALEAAGLNLLGTELVVLSACDTGLGGISPGEGVYGLRRAFAIAGSQSQVISLWKVDDQGTKDLMVKYYQRLLDGNIGRTEALRQTQLEMLRGEAGEKYSHPYFWASFIPSGNWLPIPPRKESQKSKAGNTDIKN